MRAVDQLRRVVLDEFQNATWSRRRAVYSPAIGSKSLPWTPCADVGLAQDRVQILLDEIGLAFLDHQHRALVCAERSTSASTSG